MIGNVIEVVPEINIYRTHVSTIDKIGSSLKIFEKHQVWAIDPVIYDFEVGIIIKILGNFNEIVNVRKQKEVAYLFEENLDTIIKEKDP